MTTETTMIESPPERKPDIVLSHNPSRYADDEETVDLKHLTGYAFRSPSMEQDWSKAAMKGDWMQITYKSQRSGNRLTREGQVEHSVKPVKSIGGLSASVDIENHDTGKSMAVRSDGRFEETQYLGGVVEVHLWYSEERQQADGPVQIDLPEAKPGDTLRFEYEGNTRLEEVGKVRYDRDPETNEHTGHFRYDLNYDYDRRKSGNDEPSSITDSDTPGSSHHVDSIEVVETVSPEDYGVMPDEWAIEELRKGKVILAGFTDDGEKVAKRTFSLEESQIILGGNEIRADDDGYNNQRGEDITPEPVALSDSDVTDLPVEGVDAHTDPSVEKKYRFDLRSTAQRVLRESVEETDGVEIYLDGSQRFVLTGDNLEGVANTLDNRAKREQEDGEVHISQAARDAAKAVREKIE